MTWKECKKCGYEWVTEHSQPNCPSCSYTNQQQTAAQIKKKLQPFMNRINALYTEHQQRYHARRRMEATR